MNTFKQSIFCFAFLCSLFASGCTAKSDDVSVIKLYPVDTFGGIITQSDIQIDKEITSDQNGSLRINTSKPKTVRLYETGNINIENARLIYQAKLRTEEIEGQVYLEMWCHFPGKGEYFSRALHSPLSGTNEWASQETPFFLKKAENPDNVKLNLVIDGKGTVWIEDIRLMKGPLK